MGGAGWGGGLKDYSVSPSPSPFPMDFGFGIWYLDLGLDLGLTILSYFKTKINWCKAFRSDIEPRFRKNFICLTFSDIFGLHEFV